MTSPDRRPRFTDTSLQAMYEKMLELAADPTSELYHNRAPRRGAGHRAAFWDGFDGAKLTGPKRSPHVVANTLSHACLLAGQTFALERGKRIRVRAQGRTLWLRALDALEPGRAALVRSEWKEQLDDATIFTSSMYARAVAENNPGRLAFFLEKLPPEFS